jgi:lysozyme
MIDEALDVACTLARCAEGFIPHPYLDPANVPTIGYGTTRYEDGTHVTLNDNPITQERGEALLRHHMREVALPAVQALCPNIDTAGRLGAILDFCYNEGAGRLKVSTLRQKINEGDWAAVPAELRKWRFAAGKEMRGLALRREAEIEHI